MAEATERRMRGGPLIWLPVVALVALAGVLGLKEGRARMALTEADVIAAMAGRYVADQPGAARSDCQGVPGTGAVWVAVGCGPVPFDPLRHREYRADRSGRVIAVLGPADWARGLVPTVRP